MLRQGLLTWYATAGRDLPWRESRDPYPIWVSEIMLQQTQVQTVLPYFAQWMAAFPSVASLAAADLQAVLSLWQGLGYYRRAVHLHQAAQQIQTHHGGVFPQDFDQVLALPGIGRSTAGAILSAAFNQPYPILDGNVKRVVARLVALEVPPARGMPRLWDVATQLVDPHNARDYNQAVMDLGATVCTRRRPACDVCPWSPYCLAYPSGLQEQLPMIEARSPLPHKTVGVGVVWNDQGEVLIDQRPAAGLLAHLWEFPGGKQELGEPITACIQRELREELGIEVTVGPHLLTLDHAYTHFKVTLIVHHCRHYAGEPRPIECQAIRWVRPADLDNYPFPAANQRIINQIRAVGQPEWIPPQSEG
ncbi:MAG: A/G-specific adenine glycosylase [Gloeomargaritaceae cyanobacterium C42_A2020_066]|nr:A/G-specific adenine glycosylase [Gloeomargaritaceae cyanobacterium C42_A2020_066]